jgi:hypothetical protein
VVMDKCHGDPKMKGVDQEINSGPNANCKKDK